MQNHVGMTPLHLAVYYRNAALVTLLLQYNADLEARDIQGRKAVDLAVEAENFPIVELLIAHGTKI
ncbi:lysophospholipase [Beauveria bassiana]|uniref:Lysophospholipase n=1 Tax=Beauveria bassiana TaxID=176275 RepID=A0A2N6P2U4_BEABA|nr:lysophospholipase [Beauveria bassiana]